MRMQHEKRKCSDLTIKDKYAVITPQTVRYHKSLSDVIRQFKMNYIEPSTSNKIRRAKPALTNAL